MAEYWLISAPGDKTMQQTWESMNNVTSKQNNLCVNYKFHIPDLKVSSRCAQMAETFFLFQCLKEVSNSIEKLFRFIQCRSNDIGRMQRVGG